jgi:DNA-binding transcriptional LysR family regulator
MLDLLKLETFRMVANTRSFTRAGAELGYSQSSITAHIQALEREVGAPLFERSRFSREIALTEVGRRTLEYAGRLLALAHETSIAIHSQSEPGGHLKVCANSMLLAYRLPTLLRKYQVRHPQVKLGISSWSDPRILAGSVVNGAADIAFMLDEPISSERVVAESLGREKILVVCSPEHRLAALTGGLPLEELTHSEALFSDMNCSVRMLFERALAAAGVRIENTIEAGSVEAVKRCAMAGIGFGVLPCCAVEPELAAGELVAIPLRGVELALEIQMVRSAKSWISPALRALWELAQGKAAISSAA